MSENRLMHFFMDVCGFDHPVTIVKSYSHNLGYLMMEREWVEKVRFRESYVTEENLSKRAVIKFGGEPEVYVEINFLIDNWYILTDNNEFSQELANSLLPFYKFKKGQPEILVLPLPIARLITS